MKTADEIRQAIARRALDEVQSGRSHAAAMAGRIFEEATEQMFREGLPSCVVQIPSQSFDQCNLVIEEMRNLAEPHGFKVTTNIFGAVIVQIKG